MVQESMKCFIDQNKVCSVEHDQGTVQTLHCSIQHVSEQTFVLIDFCCYLNYKTRELNAYTKRHAQERG